MSTNILLALILSLSANSAVASDDEDTTPILQTVTSSPKLNEGMTQPDFILIYDNLTTPSLQFTYGNSAFSIETTGAAQDKDQEKLSRLLNHNTKFKNKFWNGQQGLEMSIKHSGFIQKCSLQTSFNIPVAVSGICVTEVKVNLVGNTVRPIYVNGILKN